MSHDYCSYAFHLCRNPNKQKHSSIRKIHIWKLTLVLLHYYWSLDGMKKNAGSHNNGVRQELKDSLKSDVVLVPLGQFDILKKANGIKEQVLRIEVILIQVPSHSQRSLQCATYRACQDNKWKLSIPIIPLWTGQGSFDQWDICNVHTYTWTPITSPLKRQYFKGTIHLTLK